MVEEPVIHLEAVGVVTSYLSDIFDPILNRLDPAGMIMTFSNNSINCLFAKSYVYVATMRSHNL